MVKTIRHKNMVFTLHDPDLKNLSPQVILDRCSVVKHLRFLEFQGEVTPGGGESQTHLQGYLEFNIEKSFRAVNRELFANQAGISRRLGTQAEARFYCTDKNKELVCPETFAGGTPKVAYDAWNKQQKDIPLNREEQWIYIDKEIIARRYLTLEDIRRDFPYLVIQHPGKLQGLLHFHNPIDQFKLFPAKIIGFCGDSRVGKSCLVNQFLKENGYVGTEITYLKNDLETTCYFEFSDERKRALVLEEVRSEGPRNNSLLNWIDRKTTLPVKGGLIRNNYDLIVVTSLLKPAELYADVPWERKKETLARTYSGQVYKVSKDSKSLNEARRRLDLGEITPDEFQFTYRPFFEEDKEVPDEVKDLIG